MFGAYDPDLAREKKAQVLQYMRELGLDAWLILTREGSDPAMPLAVCGQTVGTAAFLFTGDRLIALVANFDVGHVELFGGVDEITGYRLGITEPLVELYRKVSPRSLALNYSTTDVLCDGLSHGQYLWLEKVLGKDELASVAVPSEPLQSRVRAVKSPIEQGYIREAVRRANRVYEAVFAELRTGMTELQAQQLFVDKVRELGYEEEGSGGPIVCIARVGLAHRGPTDAVIQPGDTLIFDAGVRCNGFTSDIARTVYFARGDEDPDQEVVRGFTTVRDAISKAFAAIKPGMQGWEIDKVARDHLVAAGYPEISHGLGHQIGRHAHDGGAMFGPRWERYGQAPYGVLEPGMMLTIEPTIIIPGGINVLVEENVLVTPDGAEMLSEREMDLVVIR